MSERPDPEFTMNELVSEIATIFERRADGEDGLVRVAELAEEMDLYPERIRKALRVLLAQGRLRVGAKHMTRLDGVVVRVPAYCIKTNAQTE